MEIFCANFSFDLDQSRTIRYNQFMQTVIVEVSGGVIQGLFSDIENLRVIKIDWDVGESPGDEVSAGPLMVDPISAIPHDTLLALAGIGKRPPIA